MNTPTQLQELVTEIIRVYPTAKFEFDPLPSGVCLLYVVLNGREFELDYSPHRVTGVSENFEDTPPFIGHDEVFPTVGEAVVRFKSLLSDAALHAAPSRMSTAFVMHDKPISQ